VLTKLKDVFNSAHADDDWPERAAVLEVEDFEFLVSDRPDPEQRPNLKRASLFFEYVSPERQALVSGEPTAMADRRYDALFQSLPLLPEGEVVKVYKKLWVNGGYRIYCRRQLGGRQNEVKLPEDRFTFELFEPLVPGEVVPPIELPAETAAGSPGEIIRQVAADQNGRSVNLRMRLIRIFTVP
jgi:hypothetical protein